MAKNNNLKDYLVDLYQGIASRKPNASKNPQDFRSEIENLVFTSDANAAASDIRAGKTAYVNDVKVTGTIKDYDNTYEEGSVPTDMLQIKIDHGNSCAYLFYDYTGTTDDFITNFSELNMNKATNMKYMFSGCSNLTTIPQLNTSEVTNMRHMFSGCSKLITIPQLDTSKVTDMAYMFTYCHNLTRIPQLDTSKVTDMSGMFTDCYNLTKIDITYMNITNSTGYYTIDFAENCYSLTKLIIRNMREIPHIEPNDFKNCYHFTGTFSSTYNPNGLKDARIYVPDNKVNAVKTAYGWRNFADIIVPLSTLEE